MNIKFYVLFFACLFLHSTTSSQYVNYIDDTGWNLGFNTGGTWQEKELVMIEGDTNFAQPFAQLSGGFTFGKTVAYFPGNRFFALDLRFRYLRGVNYGWTTSLDSIHNLNPNYQQYISTQAYRNYRMDLNDFSFEGVLSLHKLREKTGVLLYGFGGLGIVDYRVKADYLNGQVPYNYLNLNGGDDRSFAREIKRESDMEFETVVMTNQLKFMPSLGIGIGYQLSPSFSVGLEHKVTYALASEINGFNDDNINDKYHYTAFRINFDIFRNRGRSQSYIEENVEEEAIKPTTPTRPTTSTNTGTGNPTNQNTDEITYSSTGAPPTVNITNPAHHNMEVHGSLFHLQARIYHVNTKSQITLNHNGVIINRNDFQFDRTQRRLLFNVELQPGANVFEINAVNDYGFDQDETIIIYKRRITGSPPVVDITHPFNPITETQLQIQNITSFVLNVSQKSDIQFFFNGNASTQFLFNPSTKILSADVTLRQGINKVVIKAKNNFGRDSSSREIEYIVPTPPQVNIIDPRLDTLFTQDQFYDVKARTNITSIQHIKKVTVNNQSVPFDFIPSNGEIRFKALLHNGNNPVYVQVENEVGSDDDRAIIVHQDRSNQQPPDVNITDPTINPFVSQHQNVNVKAVLLRVNSRSDITLKFNNRNISNFTFDPVTKLLEVNLNLEPGKNNVLVKGKNNFGSDQDVTDIEFQQAQLLSPPIIDITYPQENTFSTSNNLLLIRGTIKHVDKYENATAYLNNVASRQFLFNPMSQNFQCQVQLSPGVNTFNIQAYNSTGTAQKTITIQYTPVECNNPAIQQISPNTNTVNTTNNKVSIMAKILHTQTIRFKENGMDIQGYNFDVNTGDFVSMLNLKPGTHTYEIVAFNTCGVVTETITYNFGNIPPCQDPVINWVSPLLRRNKAIINSPQQLISLNIKEVSLKNQIQINLNGSPQAFSFDPQTGDVNALLNCRTGINDFKIVANNGCNPITFAGQLEYLQVLNKPEIVVSSHKNGFNETTLNTAKVIGVVRNVSNKNNINVLLDGNGIPFYFDHVSKKLLVDITLKDGVNEVEIQASNSAGSISNRIEIIKKGTIPVIKLRKYGGFSTDKRPIYTTTPTVFIDGYANHVDKTSNFEYSTSPSDLAQLKFNSGSGTIVGKVSLPPNEMVSVELKITNSYGSATKHIHFYYEHFDEEPEEVPVLQQKTFDFNNSNKTNSSNDVEIEEEENTNTYFKPVNISKGSNKEKEDTNTYKEEGKNNNSSVPPRSGSRSTSVKKTNPVKSTSRSSSVIKKSGGR